MLATRVAPTRLVNATYSTRLRGRFSLVGNLGTDLRRDNALFASIGLQATFGPRTSAYAGVNRRNDGDTVNAEIAKVAMTPGDFGYRVNAARGQIDRLAVSAEYLGNAGRAEMQVEEVNGDRAARASVRGALILGEGKLAATGTQSGSFAVIDTEGQAGLTIYRDHRPVGVTDRRGRLMVGNLQPYQRAVFSIDPTELANEVSIASVESAVRPRGRAGVRVTFDLSVNRAARVRLTDTAGRPLPAGARASVGGQDLPVGIDGELYLTQLSAQNRLVVRLPGGRLCAASFPAPATIALTTVIGPIACVATARDVAAVP